MPSPLSGLGTDMPDERVEFAAVGADRPELELPGTGEDFRRLMSHAAKARSEDCRAVTGLRIECVPDGGGH